MPDTLISQLFDFGALGLFAGFLIYLYFSMQRRMDALVEKFQEQLREIETAHNDRVETMRTQYHTVIDKVRAEGTEQLSQCLQQRDELVEKLGESLNTAMHKQDAIASKLDDALSELRTCRRKMEG